MKAKYISMMLVMAVLSSISLLANQRDTVIVGDGYHFVGKWPEGKGALYSNEGGLVLGQFSKAKPQGECVCYRPNGELYWGQYKNGKATGFGKLYRDNGIVICGEFKNGRYHGTDTLYRKDGSVYVAKFKKGKLVSKISDSKDSPELLKLQKPAYPRIDLKKRHEDFLRTLELEWESRNAEIRRKAGLINPKFQGGELSDFTYWVNSRLNYSAVEGIKDDVRMVVVEFVVAKDGTVRDVYALFGTNQQLNDEAVRVVKSSPKWTPAELDGQKKNVKLSIPVLFEF